VTFRRSSGPINRSQRSALTRDGSPPRHPAALSDSFSKIAGTSLRAFASSCPRAPCRPCGIGMSPRRPSVTTCIQNRPCGSCRRDAPPWHPASSHVGLRDAGIRDEVSHFLLCHAHTHAGAPVAMSYTYRLVPSHLRGTCRRRRSKSMYSYINFCDSAHRPRGKSEALLRPRGNGSRLCALPSQPPCMQVANDSLVSTRIIREPNRRHKAKLFCVQPQQHASSVPANGAVPLIWPRAGHSASLSSQSGHSACSRHHRTRHSAPSYSLRDAVTSPARLRDLSTLPAEATFARCKLRSP
jgi:hypothetical protein